MTSTPYDGSRGGLTGADNTCQTIANNKGLGGSWKAWLSDSTGSPSTRFTQSTSGYKKLDETLIANSWSDLVDGSLLSPINIDENQASVAPGNVAWSDTLSNGNLRDMNSSCNNWNNGTSSYNGVKGNAGSITGSWSDASISTGCQNANRLYCFEQ
ncbi:DUF1554 domain-containing protein [Candidatus Daviesbacteria bacterium]|nr:DUF1554 domain-containing protein [Candidatus Daviesbacteria bacterium]